MSARDWKPDPALERLGKLADEKKHPIPALQRISLGHYREAKAAAKAAGVNVDRLAGKVTGGDAA